MIFKKFFKPKWQNKDANIRIEAINEFDPTNTDQHTILTQLVGQDPSELVRRAALIKLDNGNDWLNAYKNNDKASIKQLCESKIQTLIISSDSISNDQKDQFLNLCGKSAFLEQWLLIEHDANLISKLLIKVNKPNILSQLLLKTDNVELQNTLLKDINELDLLEKLLKKSSGKTVHLAIQEKVSMFKARIEAPIKLRKQVQLSLSKLLALKDIQSYEDMLQRKDKIEQEWQQYQHQFTCLDGAEQQQLNDKFNAINQQLNKHFVVLAENYQQQRIVKELELKLEQQKQSFTQSVATIAKQISDAIFDNVKLDVTNISAQLNTLTIDVKASLLAEPEQARFINQIFALDSKLNKLPEVTQSVSDATALIAKFSGLTAPATVEEYNLNKPLFDDWKTQWSKINKLSGDILPVSVTQARDELHSTWQLAINEFSQHQEKAFGHFRKKISELRRLISYGKYKSAFGLHKKLTFLFQEFSEQYQAKLSKDFDAVTEQVNELHELESFIVAPKKQQLLEDIKQLVKQPLDNPSKQAEQVKIFRKQWNFLGHASEELEKTLNLEFNKACEEAFEPCRQYYAEQSKIRELHLKDKQSVLNDIQKLGASITEDNINWQQVDAKLTKLMTKWRETGEIDREQYQLLFKQYRSLVDPIKKGIHKFQDENVLLKQALIVQAKKHSEDDDIFAAINHLKEIQQKWRDIGYAGPQKENQLWQSFRKTNDQLFARRDQAVKDQKNERSAELNQLEADLAVLVEEVKTQNDAQLSDILNSLDSFCIELKSHKPLPKQLLSKANEQVEIIYAKQKAKKSAKAKKEFDNLFSTLNYIATHEQPFEELTSLPTFTALPKSQQKQLLSTQKVEANVELRERLTIELEILTEVESPKSDAERRRKIQVEMLADKLMQGSLTIDDKFTQWLSCASLIDVDLNLIARIKNVMSK